MNSPLSVLRCPACGRRCAPRANYCLHCGTKIEVEPPTPTNANAGTGTSAAEENVLWSGGYSWRAAYREWIAVILFVIGLWVVRLQEPELLTLPRVCGAMILALLVVVGIVAYRVVDARFIITDQRLIHRQGFFFWKTDRIELIDIDDLRFEDGIVERMLDVGKIVIVSSDRSHPEFVLRGIAHGGAVYDLLETARRDERLRRGLFVESI